MRCDEGYEISSGSKFYSKLQIDLIKNIILYSDSLHIEIK